MERKSIMASKIYLLSLFLFLFLSPVKTLLAESTHVEYGVNFDVTPLSKGLKKVVVKNPWKGARQDFCYALWDKDIRPHRPSPEEIEGCTLISLPIRRIVVLSSTYYPMIDALGATNLMVGGSRPQWSNTPSIREGALAGRILDVGEGLNVSVEAIMGLRPDVIFTYATGGFRDVHPKLKEAGLKVVVCAEYMEMHPLGRAEWIKFFGVFFNRELEAKKVFDAIKKRYEGLALLVSHEVSHRPTVITNTPFSGRWFVPGGKSFVAQLLRDAGADFVFKETPISGSIPMDIELVYERGRSAEFWINTGTWTSLSDIPKTDPRLVEFRAVKTHHVFNNNRRVNKMGRNDYWESGVLRPDVVLKDLIHIFHPGLIVDHSLFYYRRLR